MVRKSIIELQIEALGQVMARIMVLKRKGDRKGVLTELHVAAQKLSGMDANAMLLLTDDSLVGLFTPSDGFEAGKGLLAASILKQEAEVLEEDGQNEMAASARRKSLRLYLEALIHEEFLRSLEFPQEAEALLEEVEEKDGLTASMLRRVYRYHEAMGQFARAEDRLFELREAGFDRWRPEAEAFFKRLLALPDERLQAGGLSREEAQEGLEEIEEAAA
jgi:hypothetical protein